MKKLLFVTSLVLLGILPLTSCKKESPYQYELNEDGASYTLVSGDKDAKSVYIPREYNDLPVTAIGENAFMNARVESLSITGNIEVIKEGAFSYCTDLTVLFMEDGVNEIGDFAFSNCLKLSSLELCSTLDSIGMFAFQYDASLTSVTVPNSVTEIGTGAFLECTSLADLTLSSNLGKVSECLLTGCTGLTKIYIPSKVTEIGDSAFSACRNATTITLPKSITRIGEGVFSSCEALTLVNYLGTAEEWTHIENESVSELDYITIHYRNE